LKASKNLNSARTPGNDSARNSAKKSHGGGGKNQSINEPSLDQNKIYQG